MPWGALKRGAAEVAENAARLAVNGAAWLLPEGRERRRWTIIPGFEELREFCQDGVCPAAWGKGFPWFREMLVDMAQRGASTAWRFAALPGLAC